MAQNHQFAILPPLVVGAGAVATTIFIHALALAATINLVRYEAFGWIGSATALGDVVGKP